ncbi:MAG: S8 family serine peptidase, partial [Bacteroidetes bacterium]|nr:S8 family serine peptidase [Bacteroidota bacterium]
MMKLNKLLSLLGALLLTSSVFSQNIHPDYVDGEIYLKVYERSGIAFPDLSKVNQSRNLWQFSALVQEFEITEIKLAFPLIDDEIFQHTYHLKFNKKSQADLLVKKLSTLPYVEYAEKVALMRSLYTPNDPSQGSQWYLNTINAFNAWNLHQGGSSVVAIIDDAVRLTHQDLAPNIWVNPGETPNDGIDNDNNGYVDDINGWDVADNDNNPNPPASASNSNFTHGTHVAGIAAGATDNNIGIASIGFDTKIMAVKATENNAADPNLITAGYNGVQYAMAAGADVISMSWGGNGFNQTIQNLVTSAFNQGIVLVAAAGNSNVSTPLYPAAYTNVIAVASTNQTDAKSSFSNYGTWVDISAPGSGIFSTLAGSNSSYGNQSGTSMATPVVSGLVALMKSYNPSATPAMITSCIASSADNIDAQNPGFIGQLGAGRINAFAALQCVNPNVAPIANFTQSAVTGCPGLSVQFTDLSIGNPTSWSWSVPGATPSASTQQNPTFTFPNAGTYSVTLTATNGFGNNSITQTNLITIISTGQALPFTEDFESGNFTANNWTIDNPDNSFTWEIASVGGTTPGSNAAKMNF